MVRPLFILIFSALWLFGRAQSDPSKKPSTPPAPAPIIAPPLTNNGSSPLILLAPTAPEPDRRAARVLQFYLKKMLAADVLLQTQEAKIAIGQPAIFIGKNAPGLAKTNLRPPADLAPDAHFLQAKNNQLVIAGGGDMGAEYGVYTLLERLGCRKFTPRDSFLPDLRDGLRLPDIAPMLETPAFPYRELWYEPAFDDGWARWHKLKTNPRKNEEWGLFVHTFDKLCPAAEHFERHPEYFSWNGSQRSPGQLCLSNDTVRRIVVENLRQRIREKPAARYWSVSQNDNFDYCRCSRCAASDKQLGGPAGTLLTFVNAVAAEFPEKTISTLAYQYTRQAPRGIRPARNVSVCLCSIECNRGLALTDDPTSAGFVRDVREWSQLTDNLMVWDYVVQFRSYLSPFPNWHTLQPNLQFFQKNGVRMMFEQGSGRSRSEFSDMRAYLLAKLMWNPAANMDSILTDFGKGYYGAAQPFIWRYIDTLTQNLLRTDHRLDIYGTPLSASKTWLTDRDINTYLDILGEATQAVADPSRDADHLEEAIVPLLHAMFEQFKIRDWGFPCLDSTAPKNAVCYLPAHWNMVNGFPALCQKHRYETMHENNYPPTQYASDMAKYLRDGRVIHHFMNRKWNNRGMESIDLQLVEPPSPQYAAGDPSILLDSYRGTDDYRYNWLGFNGKDLAATVTVPVAVPDAALQKITSVSVQFLQDQQSWVFFPKKVMLEVSTDGKNFRRVRSENIEIVPDGKKSIRRINARLPEPEAIRAVRVTAENLKTCPAWHPCNGQPCWIFVDEIVVE